jgi:hypothetical protein
VETASLASTRDDETITTETLRLLGHVLDRCEMYIGLVARSLHVLEEMKERKGMVSTSIDGATELCVEALMLVADVLSQMIFPKEGLLTMFGTAGDECRLVFSCTLCTIWNMGGDGDSTCSELVTCEAMVEPIGGVMVPRTKRDLPWRNDRFRNTNESRVDGSGGVGGKVMPCSMVTSVSNA